MIQDASTQLLIAMPQLTAEPFAQSVILLCEYGEQGALGLLINKPLYLSLADILSQAGSFSLSKNAAAMNREILLGGPHQHHMSFVVHTQGKKWAQTFALGDGLFLTTSQAILNNLSSETGVDPALICMGCIRWSPGELEQEMEDNFWLTAPVTESLLFECPLEQRWSTAIASIGFPLDCRLSYDIGHA